MPTETLVEPVTNWQLVEISNDIIHQGLSGGIQSSGGNGNRWQLNLSFQNMVGDRRRSVWGQFAELRGVQNRLRFRPADNGYVRSGPAGGAPVLSGVHSVGATQIAFGGAAASIVGWALRGEFLSIGNELKMITQDVDTDGAGDGTIGIWPELHHGFSDLEPIEVDDPSGVFIKIQGAAYSASPFPNDTLDPSFSVQLEEDILA